MKVSICYSCGKAFYQGPDFDPNVDGLHTCYRREKHLTCPVCQGEGCDTCGQSGRFIMPLHRTEKLRIEDALEAMARFRRGLL